MFKTSVICDFCNCALFAFNQYLTLKVEGHTKDNFKFVREMHVCKNCISQKSPRLDDLIEISGVKIAEL